MTPIKLESFLKAHELRKKQKDEEMWMQGLYNYNAFKAVLAQAFGNKQAKYPEAPLLLGEDKDSNLTEEERAILAEKQWISAQNLRGLPKTKMA